MQAADETYRYCPRCRAELQVREIDGRQRMACPHPDCGFVLWGNPVPVVAAVVEVDGRVLLTQSQGWPEHWWGLVAGFLESGETPEQAVLREVREETGLQGEIVAFIGHYTFPERNQIIMAFHLRAHGEPVVGEELQRVKLVPPQELRPWKKGTGPALRDWLARRDGLSAEP